MSLQLTMINNRRHATPLMLKSKTSHTHPLLGKMKTILCVLCRFTTLREEYPLHFFDLSESTGICSKGLTVRNAFWHHTSELKTVLIKK